MFLLFKCPDIKGLFITPECLDFVPFMDFTYLEDIDGVYL
jgi:hypothetical protein